MAQKLLFRLIREGVLIYSSTEILSEYQKVLKRDFGYSDDDVSDIMEKVFEFVTLIAVKSKCAIVEDDPDDNKIVDCAIESSSEYIVTYDKHLLKLDGCEGIRIIRPEEALKFLFQ